MAFPRNIARWLSNAFSQRKTPNRKHTRLNVECLEARDVPATLSAISNFTTYQGKNLFVPLTVDGVANSTFTVTSSNAAVAPQVVSGGRTLRLEVSGTDSTSTTFSGAITLRLFEDQAPLATQRIIDLVNSGFYNNRIFHRVINGFVTQAGLNADLSGSDSGLGDFDDEFSRSMTFNSPGLLAMANAGDETNDAQFFITDFRNPLSASINGLNFNHTIFGQLTSGFDIYTKMITTPTNGGVSGNVQDQPDNDLVITSASIITDSANGVVRLSAPSNFTGTTTITVTGNDAAGSIGSRTFTVTFQADPLNERAFLGDIDNFTTSVGKAITIQIPATDIDSGDTLTYIVRNPSNFSGSPLNATVTVTAGGRATITPNAGFTGTIQMLVGVRDQTLRPTSAGSTLNDRDQFDTQIITLTVSEFDLDATTDSGPLNDDNVTGNSSPKIIISAPAGTSSVTVNLNGTAVTGATPVAGTNNFQVTLPSNLLQVGVNTLTGTAVGTSTTTFTPFAFTYAPRLQTFYVVPGAVGSPQVLRFDYAYTESGFKSEFGVYKVDDYDGRVNSLLPNQAGYAAAALGRRQPIFETTLTTGANKTLTVAGGEIYALYLIQNDTSGNWATKNSTNQVNGSPLAFFSLFTANPDTLNNAQGNHVEVVDDPIRSQAMYSWEDLANGGDRDYNDLVVTIRLSSVPQSEHMAEAIKIISAVGRTGSTTFQLQPATKSRVGGNIPTATTAKGEVGYYSVDDALGTIDGFKPGDAGYVAAALDAARRNLLFSSGQAINSLKFADLAGDAFVGFYFIPGDATVGTAANFLANNPSNSLSGSPNAFFSFDAANPDGKEHFRTFNAERTTRNPTTPGDPIRLHFMGIDSGGVNDFDDLVISMRQEEPA